MKNDNAKAAEKNSGGKSDHCSDT